METFLKSEGVTNPILIRGVCKDHFYLHETTPNHIIDKIMQCWDERLPIPYETEIGALKNSRDARITKREIHYYNDTYDKDFIF